MGQTVRECIEALKPKAKDRKDLFRMAKKATKASDKTILNSMAKVWPSDRQKPRKTKNEIPGAQTITEFGKPYDYPQKVLDALCVLHKSSKDLCPDEAFRKYCGIGGANWTTIKTLKILSRYHRKMPNGQILWGSQEALNEAEKRARHIYE